jgi:8-oxo-dGTP pyrophosphatase MutT (NUDIX family)
MFSKNKIKKMTSEWLPAPFLPPRQLTIQSSGICFTRDHRITLVSEGETWMLPGGAPLDDESLKEALIREIAEEACARVIDCQYIGCIRCKIIRADLNPDLLLFYKARFWAKIENEKFDPRHETTSRIEIQPREFVNRLSWNAGLTAQVLLDAAMSVELRREPS